MTSINNSRQISDPYIIDIGPDLVDEAAQVLANVFIHYPLEQYLFAGHGSETHALLISSFRMDCLWKLGMGWPLAGVLADGKLAAVVAVLGRSTSGGGAISFEGCPLTADRLAKMEENLNRSFGGQTYARIREYYAMKEIFKPQTSHLYVESLATLPEYRGKGFGGMLLKYVDQLVKEDLLSTGAALDTQDPVNLKIYGHLGYIITGEADLGPVHNWFLLKSKVTSVK